MIVKIENIGNNAWHATTNDGKISHSCGPDYFLPAIVAATPVQGDAVYYEAAMDADKGELVFGAPSTAEAFNAS